MAQEQTPQPPAVRAAAGLTGPRPWYACIALIPIPTRHDSGIDLESPAGVVAEFDLRALTALPMRRAIVMVICGKADVVHHDHRPDDPSATSRSWCRR